MPYACTIHTNATETCGGRSRAPRREETRCADKLVYCHEAMHVQLRNQDAAWSADVARWESDEDSDNSDSEAEADSAFELSEDAVRLLVRLLMQ